MSFKKVAAAIVGIPAGLLAVLCMAVVAPALLLAFLVYELLEYAGFKITEEREDQFQAVAEFIMYWGVTHWVDLLHSVLRMGDGK